MPDKDSRYYEVTIDIAVDDFAELFLSLIDIMTEIKSKGDNEPFDTNYFYLGDKKRFPNPLDAQCSNEQKTS